MRRIVVAVASVTVLLAAGCSDDSGDTAEESAATTSTDGQATSTSIRPLPTVTTVPWVQPEGCADPEGTAPPAVCPDPPTVPAVVGPVDITVNGHGFSADTLGVIGYTELFVFACPGADLPEPTPVPSGLDPPPLDEAECGGSAFEQAVLDGEVASDVPVSEGNFTTPLRVIIDQSAIDAGRLAIVAGDLLVPKAAVGVLQVGDQPE